MIQIGPSLAAARRARGLELRDAEHLTNLRGKYLAALEDERFYDLPGRAYARAFLRTYATVLDLDADKFIAEFDEQLPAFVEEQPLAARPRRRRSSWRLAPVAAAISVVSLLVWSAWSSDHGQPTVASPPAPVANAAPPVAHVHAAEKTVERSAPLVIRATTGPCWVLARRGGATGAVLAERTLQPGESLRFAAKNVWLRLGAPWNVSVQRGAHHASLTGARRPVNIAF